MAFTTPCFIRKNTAELRRKLESLGYKKGAYPLPVGREDVYDRDIHLYENSYHFRNSTLYGITNNIDCGDNEELFLALAALRDDKPDYQWFLWEENDGKYHIELDDTWRKYIPNEKWEEWWWFEVRKATVEEIIEHFKKD